MNKPLLLDPHLVFNLIHPQGRHFPLHCEPEVGLDQNFKWSILSVLFFFFFPEVSLVSFHTSRADTVNLKEASSFVI